MHQARGRFEPEMANPLLCTHMMYGFAKLGDNNEIAVYEEGLDLGDTDWQSSPVWGRGFYRRTEHLRDVNPDLKVLISIGGWNEGSNKYSKMAANAASRAQFVNSVVKFLKEYKFDGLDVDWEFPGFAAETGPDHDRTPGDPKDKQNYIELLRELRAALKPHNYLLTAAVSAGKATIDVAYDVKQLDQLLDFINIMSYDFHGGSFENITGHNAPLYADPKADEKQKILTVSYGVEYWLKLGLSPKKLNMGFATFGRSFTLADPNNHGLGAPAVGKGGNIGPYTNQAGMLGYNEVCEYLKAGWTAYRDNTQKIVYAVKGNQWVGYDDEQTFQDKLEYLKAKGLGGAMVWSIDTDDFHGYCGPLKHPLIKTISRELNGITGTPDPVIHEVHIPHTTTVAPPMN
ncbi:unnamed protein product [Medioppia subpectinata]|uniref:GH18 domain-containing protein n=1 Tax=Medioppia subpectinata TaxID=1979941 RepID=A0A7R9L443_9ACAR|nr:unnamed protein product [Medioppia subpectinata]CAG2115208.1 unnamed protein product [Medioppia subpectinata]